MCGQVRNVHVFVAAVPDVTTPRVAVARDTRAPGGGPAVEDELPAGNKPVAFVDGAGSSSLLRREPLRGEGRGRTSEGGSAAFAPDETENAERDYRA